MLMSCQANIKNVRLRNAENMNQADYIYKENQINQMNWLHAFVLFLMILLSNKRWKEGFPRILFSLMLTSRLSTTWKISTPSISHPYLLPRHSAHLRMRWTTCSRMWGERSSRRGSQPRMVRDQDLHTAWAQRMDWPGKTRSGCACVKSPWGFYFFWTNSRKLKVGWYV